MVNPTRLQYLLRDLPQARRDLDTRLTVSPVDIRLARLYSRHYYDGTREQGYGGYHDDGRWVPVAKQIYQTLEFSPDDSVCEIGSAKSFLLNAFLDHTPISEAYAVDASHYALSKSSYNEGLYLIHANAVALPFADNSIDHLISINSLHNFLDRAELVLAIAEIQRVTIKSCYIRIAAFNNLYEKSLIDQWATAGRGYFHVDEWLSIFKEAGYRGYYDWWHPDPQVFA